MTHKGQPQRIAFDAGIGLGLFGFHPFRPALPLTRQLPAQQFAEGFSAPSPPTVVEARAIEMGTDGAFMIAVGDCLSPP